MNDSDMLARRVPKYVRIAEALKLDMSKGLLVDGDQLPSFAVMTRQFQVAKDTIEKAHDLLEREGLVRREQGRGIFVESQKKKLTGNIGLLLPAAARQDSYTLELLAGVQQQARAYRVNLILVDEQTPISSENIDGILLMCNHYQVPALALPEQLPRVLLLSPAAELDIANVVADDFAGGKMATAYLLKQGHRRITCMMASEFDTYSLRRLAGYRAALDEADIKFDERLCFHPDKGTRVINYFLHGENYMRQLFARGWQSLNSTAILAPNDMAALGVMKALDAVEINVPREVSVVGFDGVNLGDNSPLTTIKVPLREIGAAGLDLLWEHVQKGGHFSKQITLPVSFVLGQSTAPVK